MKITCALLFFAATVTCAYAAVATYPYEEKPAEFADQEGCYIDDLKRVLPYSKPWYPRNGKSCLQYTCQKNNETQLVSCGIAVFSSLPDNCRVVEDYSQDYPKCCKTLVCDPTTEAPPSDTCYGRHN